MLALVVILTLSLLIVIAAADRPSLLSATSHEHFFPGWMAGPLGGLWPGFTRSPATLRALFTAAMVTMYLSWIFAIRYVPLLRARWAIGAVLCVNAIVLLSPPLSLTDIFNYINYARMDVFHNLNPYVTTAVLEPHTDPSYYLSNWHQLLSPYGELFTLLTMAVVPLGVAGSFWAMKVILVLSSLAIVLLVWRCAKLLDRDPVQAIVFAGLNPLVLIWGLAGDHNDFLMVLPIMLGFYLLLVARARATRARDAHCSQSSQRASLQSSEGAHSSERAPTYAQARPESRHRPSLGISALAFGAGVAFAAAVAVKASGAILLPVVLAALLHDRRRLSGFVLGLLAGGLVLGACSYAAFGANLPNLDTQSTLVTALSLPNLLGLALGQGGETATLRVLITLALLGAVAFCAFKAWRDRDPITWAGWALVALIVSLSWVLPWYVLWVLPLAALSRSRRLRVAAAVLGAYLILTWAPGLSSIYNSIGFHPSFTALGRLHQREVTETLH